MGTHLLVPTASALWTIGAWLRPKLIGSFLFLFFSDLSRTAAARPDDLSSRSL
jgi:hypothetical protein